MKRSGLAAGLYVALVFVCGAMVGMFGYRLYTARVVNASVAPRPADYRQKYVDEMTTRMHLSKEQVSQLGIILDDTRNRFHEEHERTKQQLAQIHSDQVQKIHEILSPAQLPEYEKFRADREKQRELREKTSKDHQPK